MEFGIVRSECVREGCSDLTFNILFAVQFDRVFESITEQP